MLQFTLFIIIFCFLLVSSFCCTSKDNTIKDNENASLWINRSMIPYSVTAIYGIEEIAFSIIPDEQKKEYISRLEHTQFIELEVDEYLKLTKKNLKKKYALAIRAVYTHLGGNFFIEKNYKNEYSVYYIVMGSKVWELNKTVLIIEVDDLPKELFIGYTVVK